MNLCTPVLISDGAGNCLVCVPWNIIPRGDIRFLCNADPQFLKVFWIQIFPPALDGYFPVFTFPLLMFYAFAYASSFLYACACACSFVLWVDKRVWYQKVTCIRIASIPASFNGKFVGLNKPSAIPTRQICFTPKCRNWKC